jgi:DNA-directed RNA polymerase specialized sigma24 family protein
MEVFGELAGFRGGYRQFRTWLFTLAHRHLVGQRGATPGSAGGRAPGDGTDEWLMRVSAVLSHDQRTVLALRGTGGLTVEEVAEVIGAPVRTVRARQREALAVLQRHLSQNRPAGGPPE